MLTTQLKYASSASAIGAVKKLVTDAYGPICYRPQHDQTIDKIWSEPGNAARLEALLDDRSAPLRARLIAAEVLMRKDFNFLDRWPR